MPGASAEHIQGIFETAERLLFAIDWQMLDIANYLAIIHHTPGETHRRFEFFDALHLTLELLRMPPVVRINKRNPIPARRADTVVSRGRNSRILLMDHPDICAESLQFIDG